MLCMGKEMDMITYMYYVCEKLKMTSQRLFRIAYRWQYNQDGDTRQDFDTFMRDKKLPHYVEMYLEHIRDSKVKL